ncbi:MAG: hypothetical protein M1815_005370 [Lichina confinis]|nr:MAG: hypothetical protein M1815_005370 [Lichina confinis]
MEVVAGGVGIASFAIQLTDQIIKFKRFWDCVKEAPEDVAFIIEDIETLAMVLTGIGDQSKADPLLAIDKASADRCILSCQAAMKQLSTAVNHLDKSISKHKWLGATKAALKKDVLAKLMARVERAKAKLTLSNQIYIMYVSKLISRGASQMSAGQVSPMPSPPALFNGRVYGRV